MSLPNYYKLLEVDRSASREVIEKAYKALAKKYHPDTAEPTERRRLHEKMRSINEAYSVLSDPKKRQAYDRTLKKRLWEVFLEDGLIGVYKELGGS